MLLHDGALNLGLLMRQLVGVGTPRSLLGRLAAARACLWSMIQAIEHLRDPNRGAVAPITALGQSRARRDDPELTEGA